MALCKQVRIWVNPVTKKVGVLPERIHLNLRSQDCICWSCDQGSVKIHFPGESPFAEHTYDCGQGGSVCTGLIVVGPSKKEREYHYEVTVKVAKADKPKAGKRQYATFKLDPEVIVDPDTP